VRIWSSGSSPLRNGRRCIWDLEKKRREEEEEESEWIWWCLRWWWWWVVMVSTCGTLVLVLEGHTVFVSVNRRIGSAVVVIVVVVVEAVVIVAVRC